jgi:hypothetical protein
MKLFVVGYESAKESVVGAITQVSGEKFRL